MKFENRIRALEAEMTSAPVILYLADGSTRALRGQRDFLLDLLAGVCGGPELSTDQAAQLHLVRQSVAAQEPGGGRMVELLRALLHRSADG